MTFGFFRWRAERNQEPDSVAAQAAAVAAAEHVEALRAALARCDRLHLACNKVILDGWINIDIDPFPGAYRWDLSAPLPIESKSASWVFSEHFIEHMTRDEAVDLVRRCHDALRSGGVMRISTPDLAFVIDEYTAGRTGEWSDMGWLPETRCRMVNGAMRLWGHRFLYDIDELTALCREGGFSRVERTGWRESAHDVLRGLESRPYHHELIGEATRVR